MTAAVTIARLAFRLPGHHRPGSGEVDRRLVAVDGTVTAIGEPSSMWSTKRYRPPGRRLRAAASSARPPLDVPHVGLDHRQGVALDQRQQVPRALRLAAIWAAMSARLSSTARVGYGPDKQQLPQLVQPWPARSTTLKLPISTPSSARFVEKGGIEPGVDAADLGMMCPAGGEEQQPPVGGVVDRRDHGHVGQVGAAAVGIVGEEDVARPDLGLSARISRPSRSSRPGGRGCGAR